MSKSPTDTIEISPRASISRLFITLLVVFFYVSPSIAEPKDASFEQSKLQPLADELRKGGYIFIIRHAQKWDQGPDARAVRSAFDAADAALASPILVPEEYQQVGAGMCLTNLGKANAWLLGEAFRRLEFPINKVLTSATCRTRQHAEIMFNDAGQILVEPALIFGDIPNKSQVSATHKMKKRLLKEHYNKNKNLVIIAHGRTAQEAGLVDFWQKQGETLIFSKNSDSFELRAHLSTEHFIRMLPQRVDW